MTRDPCPQVWIVILNWNGRADTLECLESLERLRYPNFHVLVVDNGSLPGETERFGEASSRVSVLSLPKNRGFTGGSNAGIRFALEKGADYVWLLNNDTTVDPACLSALVDAAEDDPRVGALSPVIYDYAPPRGIQFCGTFLDRRTRRQRSPRSLEEARLAAKEGVLLLWGTALLLKRTLIDAIGLLDERYFAYHEDLDYSLRAIAAGFELRVVSEAAVLHKLAHSLGSTQSPIREYLVVRNWYLLWRSHRSLWPRYSYPRGFLVWALKRALEARESGRRPAASHVLDGIWDAFRGREGSWDQKGQMPGVVKRLILDGLLAWHPHVWIGMLEAGPLEVVRRSLRKRRHRVRDEYGREVED